METSFGDPELVSLTDRISAYVDSEIDATFPEDRLASVTVHLRDGSVLKSGMTRASGGPDPQPSEAEVVGKFHVFADPVIGRARSEAIIAACLSMNDADASFHDLLDILTKAA